MRTPHRSRARRRFHGIRASALVIPSLALAAVSTPGRAQEAGGSRWQFEFTPYVWAAGMDGSVRVDDKPQSGVAVSQSFSDILEILEFALMGELEARKDRWGVLVDGVYFKVEDEGSVSGRAGLSSLDAKAAITQQMYSLAGSYRMVEGHRPVDLFGGLRYMSVKWDVDISASVPVLPLAARRFTERKDWVDPYIGARIQQPLGDRWSLVGYADIGGFGLGSDLAIQAIGGVSYAFRPDIIGKLGYRYVSTDYDKHGFKYDIANAGFYLGVGLRW